MSETYVISETGRATIFKDPDATLDYSIDWTAWMAADDTITDLEVIVITPIVLEASGFESVIADPTGSPEILETIHTTTAFLSGGVAGSTYPVTFRITTASTPPRIDDRTIYLRIKER